MYPGRPGEHRWAEDAAGDPQGVVGGYRQTKWVGDRKMAQAHERGIPTCVYRPGQVSGAQHTGACSTDTFLNAAVKGCVQLGAAMEFDVTLEMTPVDFFVEAMVHVALSGDRHGTAFNVPAARTLSWHRLVELLGECGYPLRGIPYRAWFRELSRALDSGQDNELARFVALFGEDMPSEDLGYEVCFAGSCVVHLWLTAGPPPGTSTSLRLEAALARAVELLAPDGESAPTDVYEELLASMSNGQAGEGTT